MAAITFEISHGNSSAPRSSVDWVNRCISDANSSAITVWKPIFRRTYSIVTHIAFQNSGSLLIFTKLSKPMNFGVPSRLYCVRLK